MERILIIDDEELNRTATEMSLKRAGYKVFTADSGEAGIAFLKERRVDLVLLDIDMLEMTGLETLQIIRDTPKLANLKVVFLTASGFREDVTEAIRLGAMDFLKKPCTPAILVERVQHALARTNKDTLLIVDDELMNLQAMKCILDIRYHVITAESGEEALELLKTKRVDLFLLDLHMPGMDGLELLEQIRDIDWAEELPVIFLTGDTEPETEIRIFRAGAFDYLRKPIIAQVALQRINRILELKHLQDSMWDELEETYRKLSERPNLRKLAEKENHKEGEPNGSEENEEQKDKTPAEVEYRKKEIDSGTQSQFIAAMLAILDEKDPSIADHCRRVAKYAREIARRMGKEPEELEEIYNAGLLHDIGKIGLPKKLLDRNDRLKGEELSTFQSHTLIGASILEKIATFPGYAEAAHRHHERYDGLGYPSGMLGADIPEIARIMAVADSYDMMTSSQGYRDALPQYMARQEFERDDGRHYDPHIAAVMLKIIDDDKDYELHE